MRGKASAAVLFVLASAFVCAAPASAESSHLPSRRLRDYHAPARETLVRVRTARVVAADYELLKRDFPQLRPLSPGAIDDWLLERAAFISLPQAQNPMAAELHEPIEYDRQSLKGAYRPEEYRRGIVFDVSEQGQRGLLDGKGFGARDPRPGLNSNGLLPLSEAVREFAMEKTVRKIFEAAGGKFTTVGTYAVFDWGFSIHGQGRAGAVLRQAHSREHWNFNSNLPKAQALEIELLLRRYGLTSTALSDALRRQSRTRFDLINVQGRGLPGGGAAVVDFGTLVRVPSGYRFTRPLAVRENLFFSQAVLDNSVGANREVGVLTEVLSAEDPAFLREAAEEGAVPAELFAAEPANGDELYPETDRVTTRARQLEQGDRGALEAFIARLLDSVRPVSGCEKLLTRR